MEVTTARFDYASIEDKEIRGKLVHHEGRIKKLYSTAMVSIVELGEELAAAQATMANHGDGVFGKWIEQSFPFSRTMAYNFINVATRFGGDCTIIGQLPDTALYLLAAPETPDKAIKEAVKRIDKGERVTVAVAKEIVAKHKPHSDNGKDTKRQDRVTAVATETSTDAGSGPCLGKGQHSWTSDGNGERYCEHCKEDHPDNKPSKKESKAATHLRGIAKTIEHLRIKIDDVVREHGKHATTDAIMKDLDKALIGLRKWAGAVK